jgi:hypothetical protein
MVAVAPDVSSRHYSPAPTFWGTALKKLLGLVGATVGSAVGWWIGAHVGIMTAFMVSTVGTGAGIYAGIRVANHLGI